MFLSWRTATATESNCGLISFRQGLSSAHRILTIEQWEILMCCDLPFLAVSLLWGHVKEEGGREKCVMLLCCDLYCWCAYVPSLLSLSLLKCIHCLILFSPCDMMRDCDGDIFGYVSIRIEILPLETMTAVSLRIIHFSGGILKLYL